MHVHFSLQHNMTNTEILTCTFMTSNLNRCSKQSQPNSSASKFRIMYVCIASLSSSSPPLTHFSGIFNIAHFYSLSFRCHHAYMRVSANVNWTKATSVETMYVGQCDVRHSVFSIPNNSYTLKNIISILGWWNISWKKWMKENEYLFTARLSIFTTTYIREVNLFCLLFGHVHVLEIFYGLQWMHLHFAHLKIKIFRRQT